MLSRTFLWLAGRSTKVRRRAFPLFFELLARGWRDADDWTFMNYGFADGEAGIALAQADEHERYCAQLYRRAVGGLDLAGKDVLEVSCGRGGGASYVRRYLRPKTVTGVDISPTAIAFCRRVHRMPGLRFLQGDAEDLPIFESSMDAVINVEASMLYGDFDRFLAEVRRVLKPGGHLLFADLRLATEVDGLIGAFRRSGLGILQVDDITRNVVQALTLDHDRRSDQVDRSVPWPLRGLMRTFAGTLGTRMPTRLDDGRMRYLCGLLRRPEDDKLIQSPLVPSRSRAGPAPHRLEVPSPAGAGR